MFLFLHIAGSYHNFRGSSNSLQCLNVWLLIHFKNCLHWLICGFIFLGCCWLVQIVFGLLYISHLLYLVVACRAGCHERWDELEPHGTPRLLELPRWVPVALEGIPPDWCHGAQRPGKALWFHDQDQPPINGNSIDSQIQRNSSIVAIRSCFSGCRIQLKTVDNIHRHLSWFSRECFIQKWTLSQRSSRTHRHIRSLLIAFDIWFYMYKWKKMKKNREKQKYNKKPLITVIHLLVSRWMKNVI